MASDPKIASTIHDQLGAGKFVAMTGADNFIRGENWLGFRIRAKCLQGITHCRITLLPTDEYHMEFYRIRSYSRRSVNAEQIAPVKLMADYKGLQADAIKGVFESATGLRISL